MDRGHSDQEGGSSPRPSLARDLGRSADPGGPGNPLLSPPSLALSPGATMGKGGQSPVESGHRTVRLKPRVFKIGSTLRHTSTRAHRAPRPHRAHTRSHAEVAGSSPAAAWLFPGGCGFGAAARVPGGAARGGQRAALRGLYRPGGGPHRGLARRSPPVVPTPKLPRSRGARTRQSAHKRPGPLYGKEISLKSEILVPFPS